MSSGTAAFGPDCDISGSAVSAPAARAVKSRRRRFSKGGFVDSDSTVGCILGAPLKLRPAAREPLVHVEEAECRQANANVRGDAPYLLFRRPLESRQPGQIGHCKARGQATH